MPPISPDVRPPVPRAPSDRIQRLASRAMRAPESLAPSEVKALGASLVALSEGRPSLRQRVADWLFKRPKL